MKIKVAAMLLSLIYLPLYLWFVHRILVEIGASELLFFVFWLMIPFAFATTVLGKLAEWEDD